ncbi:MAG: FecR domain-containing protein [Candidatus Didemnitutus sp.]|nr:FecR domain-containing protein [Candidatus Didemnitutus sp.]
MKSRRSKTVPPGNNDKDVAAGDSQHALDWAVSQGAVDRVLSRVAGKLQRRRRRRWGVVAGVAGLVVLWGLFAYRSEPNAPIPAGVQAPAPVIARAPGHQVLPDGTAVDLREGAELRVAFEPAVRRVVLERGEAHFQVQKDPQRPFVVVAHGVEVRAVGTAFAVQIGGGAVDVLVTEGIVSVEKPEQDRSGSAAPFRYARVTAGNRTVVNVSAPPVPTAVVPVGAREMDEALTWRIPLLEFDAAPLSEVVESFNRHSTARLVIADADLRSLELSGILRADKTESLLQLLKKDFGVVVERREHEIVLRRGR